MRRISISEMSVFIFSIICCCGFSFIMPFRMGLIVIFILCVFCVKCNRLVIPVYKSPVSIPYFLFVLYIAIGLLYSYERIQTIKFLIVYIAGAALVLIPFEESFYLRCQKIIELLCRIIAGSIIIQIFIPNLYSSYLYFLIRGSSSARQRLAGEVSNHIYSGIVGEKSEAAFLMVVAVINILARSVSEKRISRQNKIWLAVYFVAMVLPAKRMLFAIGILMVLLYAMFWTRGSKKVVALSGVGLMGIVGYILMSIVPVLNTLLVRFTSFADDDTANGRTYLWEYAIEMFRERPLFGYGYGSYNTYASEKGVILTDDGTWISQAHNIYYQLLGETGIIGFVFFLLICICTLYVCFRLYKIRHLMNKSDIALLFIGVNFVVLTLIYGLTGNVIYYTNQVMFFFFGISISVCLYRKYLRL